jgi:hypothetical protein
MSLAALTLMDSFWSFWISASSLSATWSAAFSALASLFMIFDSLRPIPSVPHPTALRQRSSRITARRPRKKNILSSFLMAAFSRGLSSSSALAARTCRLGSTSGGSFAAVAAPLANALPLTLLTAALRFVRRDATDAEGPKSAPSLTAAAGVASEGRLWEWFSELSFALLGMGLGAVVITGLSSG